MNETTDPTEADLYADHEADKAPGWHAATGNSPDRFIDEDQDLLEEGVLVVSGPENDESEGSPLEFGRDLDEDLEF